MSGHRLWFRTALVAVTLALPPLAGCDGDKDNTGARGTTSGSGPGTGVNAPGGTGVTSGGTGTTSGGPGTATSGAGSSNPR